MQQKADDGDMSISSVPGAFYRVSTLNSPPIGSQGLGPSAENGFRDFHRAKMSREDTQYKHNKLPKIQLNS